MQVGQGEMGCELDGKEMKWDGNGNGNGNGMDVYDTVAHIAMD